MQTMTTECKLTLSGKGKVKGKGKPQDDQHEQCGHQHVQEFVAKRTLGKGLLETQWRSLRPFHQQHSEGQGSNERQNQRRTSGYCGNRSDEFILGDRINRFVSFTNTERNWIPLVHFKRGTVDHGCDNQFSVFCRKAKPIQSNAREEKNYKQLRFGFGINWRVSLPDINWEVHYKTVVCQELIKITSQHCPSHE